MRGARAGACPGVQGYRGTWVQGYMGPGVQGSRDPGVTHSTAQGHMHCPYAFTCCPGPHTLPELTRTPHTLTTATWAHTLPAPAAVLSSHTARTCHTFVLVLVGARESVSSHGCVHRVRVSTGAAAGRYQAGGVGRQGSDVGGCKAGGGAEEASVRIDVDEFGTREDAIRREVLAEGAFY